MLAFRNPLLNMCQKQHPNILLLTMRSYNKPQPVPVTWIKPDIGWTKLNFDGSSKNGRASIGGLFRNHKAEFLLGYAESIGEANSTVAELYALRRGLDFVVENGWSNVWLEGDAKTLLDVIINRRRVKCKECQRQIGLIIEIIDGHGCIVSHVYRQGNRAADRLANIGHRFESPRVWTCEPPQEISRYVQDDAEEKSPPVPVTWKKPEIGWTKLNFDGSSNIKNRKASIGGVLRNHKAEFLVGYAESIGEANSAIAELSALRRGLELVLENGWSQVWLEGDAKTLLDVIVNHKQFKCPKCQSQIGCINKIIARLSACKVSHVYREGNRTADRLAQLGHFLDSPRVWIGRPPPEISSYLNEDAEGKIINRRR